jgi:hypothetical protein
MDFSVSTMNDDWAALCAIYGKEGDVFPESNNKEHPTSASTNSYPDGEDNELYVRLTTTKFPQGDGFCGTVYLTLSTSKVVFARRVNDAGHYRYFSLQRSPS